MNTENTKAQMRKGILEFCILSLINKKEMYVSDLIDELKKGKLDVVEGTLYPLLTRLKTENSSPTVGKSPQAAPHENIMKLLKRENFS